jgi:hypothetical protein
MMQEGRQRCEPFADCLATFVSLYVYTRLEATRHTKNHSPTDLFAYKNLTLHKYKIRNIFECPNSDIDG